MTEKVQGPRSYFPSIEKTYGRPVEDGRAAIVRASLGTRGRAPTRLRTLVEILKDEHGWSTGIRQRRGRGASRRGPATVV